MALKIDLYSTVTCHRCTIAQRMLEKRGFEVTKHVINDRQGNVVPEYVNTIKELDIRQTPVIVWPDGEVTHGFSETVIDNRTQVCANQQAAL